MQLAYNELLTQLNFTACFQSTHEDIIRSQSTCMVQEKAILC